MNFLRHTPDEQSPFDINTAVEVCLDVARPLLIRQQVTLRTNLSPHISICVGDFVLVRQAILNLIYNACQAMEAQADPRELIITTRSENAQLILTIEDTGPGVREKDRQTLYPLYNEGKEGHGAGAECGEKCDAPARRRRGAGSRRKAGCLLQTHLPLSTLSALEAAGLPA